ncbi:hypothetical protein APY04_0532 [Hyphomicrobium sulfonivorans]|uniref:Uncharacterized protein n=1 Tax=Hyphomicrobium sulfonivorans TaxID=121290 RepID=A0A109BMA5_HYPSL|nr:hypothetical protein APY04_0532 [Hyphomicrobium sulfonivorans]
MIAAMLISAMQKASCCNAPFYALMIDAAGQLIDAVTCDMSPTPT